MDNKGLFQNPPKMWTENAIFNIHKKPSTIYDVGRAKSCPLFGKK